VLGGHCVRDELREKTDRDGDRPVRRGGVDAREDVFGILNDSASSPAAMSADRVSLAMGRGPRSRRWRYACAVSRIPRRRRVHDESELHLRDDVVTRKTSRARLRDDLRAPRVSRGRRALEGERILSARMR
jgi:hypothetical protein